MVGCSICQNLFADFNGPVRFWERDDEPPQEQGVYVICVRRRGLAPQALLVQALQLTAPLNRTFPRLAEYAEGKLERLTRVRRCPVLWVGYSGNLKNRYGNLRGGHVAQFPVWALALAGWELEFWYKPCADPEANEGQLLASYQNLHGALPALNDDEGHNNQAGPGD